MNAVHQHNDWLSLVDRSGPFVSLPVLLRVFPQGLERRDPERVALLREAYDDWRESGTTSSAVHHGWVRHVLTSMLEYEEKWLVEGQAIPPGLTVNLPTYGETIQPDLVLRRADTDAAPLLLIAVHPPSQGLEKPMAGKLWKASPATRMTQLLHGTGVPVGLVTNGEQWMLVSARPKETSGFATWHADLWMQEEVTLRAFHSLLHQRRFTGVAESDTLPMMLAESSEDQQEVTDQLGYQVRKAVEVLVQAFDQLDEESGRTLLAGVSEKDLYDSALTVMMRLVFLFSAEERGLLLLGDPLYNQNYAVSTLSGLLREQADQQGEEVLERRQDAWCRLLATFRAVHSGIEHEALRLPAYGGTLFDPDRYPFLEGRGFGTAWRSAAAKPVRINNRVALHLLEAMQFLRVKVPGGPAESRRLSFSELGVEQIGHVYEGLLDHTAKSASEVVLGLSGSKDKEPEIPLAVLEESRASGLASLAAMLHEQTGRSEKAIQKLASTPMAIDEHALLVACGQDHMLLDRVKPFANLLRGDSFDRPVVIRPGHLFVTAGSDRRNTGTHYTPPSLTAPIVRYTLEPLVYVGPADGLPPAEWTLKDPKAILSLKVCDMAMGSGAFLVEVCRYLGDRLVEAWENTERAYPGSFVVNPDGDLSTGSAADRLLPLDAAERVALARRYVADRCLYGVDINPMAVEMAKLSLWLVTLQRDRPFTFLDHCFKCGDSLVGLRTLDQLEKFSLLSGERQATFASLNLSKYLEKATQKRRELEALPSNDYVEIQSKRQLHAESDQASAVVRALADALVAFEMQCLPDDLYDAARTDEAERIHAVLKSGGPGHSVAEAAADYAVHRLQGRRVFQWPIEFPEVFAQGGFDAVVGNPPFLGGTRISTVYGADYLSFLARNWPSFQGRADLCSLFFLRGYDLLRGPGILGLIATNTISQGDTREAGLDEIVRRGGRIFRATSSMQWPGHAGLAVSVVHVAKGTAGQVPVVLDDREEPFISAFLNPAVTDDVVHPLVANASLCFAGSKLDGMGFVISPIEAQELVRRDSRNAKVVRVFVNGDDVTSQPVAEGTRYVIDFRDWTNDEAKSYAECFQIVEERVFPERQTHSEKRTRDNWWHFQRSRPELYSSLKGLSRVLVIPRVSKFVLVAFVSADAVFSDALNVVATDDAGLLAILQSDIHEAWARARGSTLETRMRYTPTDCFETFPRPPITAELRVCGEKYDGARRKIMLDRQEGLTKIYNRFHDKADGDEDTILLRTLHVNVSQTVASNYGWSDLDLSYDFHLTRQGMRYTLGESSRRQVLGRLLELNHKAFADESKTAAHQKKDKKFTRNNGRRSRSGQGNLLG